MAPEGAGGRRLAAALLRRGVAVRITVHGESMRPTLRDGDRVEIAPLSRPAAVGDVVLGSDPSGGVRLHRVLRRVGGGRVQTRGDALWRMDPVLEADAVLGRVRRMQRAGGPWRALEPRLLGRTRALAGRLESGLRHGVARLLPGLSAARGPGRREGARDDG